MSRKRDTSLKLGLRIAFQASIVKRAAVISVIVGSILVLINHGDNILDASITSKMLIQILLTYMVPYAVSTYSSVIATIEKNQLRP